MGFHPVFAGLLFFLLVVVLGALALIVAVAYAVGWAFRKGWNQAQPQGDSEQHRPPAS